MNKLVIRARTKNRQHRRQIRQNLTKYNVAAARKKRVSKALSVKSISCNFCHKSWPLSNATEQRIKHLLQTTLSLHYKRECKFLCAERLRILSADFSSLQFDDSQFLNAFTNGQNEAKCGHLPVLYLHILKSGQMIYDVISECLRISYIGSAADISSSPLHTRHATHVFMNTFDDKLEQVVPLLWSKNGTSTPVRVAEAVMLIFLSMFPQAKNCGQELLPLFELTCEEFSLVADSIFRALHSMTKTLIRIQIQKRGLNEYLKGFDAAEERIKEKANQEIEKLRNHKSAIQKLYESE